MPSWLSGEGANLAAAGSPDTPCRREGALPIRFTSDPAKSGQNWFGLNHPSSHHAFRAIRSDCSSLTLIHVHAVTLIAAALLMGPQINQHSASIAEPLASSHTCEHTRSCSSLVSEPGAASESSYELPAGQRTDWNLTGTAGWPANGTAVGFGVDASDGVLLGLELTLGSSGLYYDTVVSTWIYNGTWVPLSTGQQLSCSYPITNEFFASAAPDRTVWGVLTTAKGFCTWRLSQFDWTESPFEPYPVAGEALTYDSSADR